MALFCVCVLGIPQNEPNLDIEAELPRLPTPNIDIASNSDSVRVAQPRFKRENPPSQGHSIPAKHTDRVPTHQQPLLTHPGPIHYRNRREGAGIRVREQAHQAQEAQAAQVAQGMQQTHYRNARGAPLSHF